MAELSTHVGQFLWEMGYFAQAEAMLREAHSKLQMVCFWNLCMSIFTDIHNLKEARAVLSFFDKRSVMEMLTSAPSQDRGCKDLGLGQFPKTRAFGRDGRQDRATPGSCQVRSLGPSELHFSMFIAEATVGGRAAVVAMYH